MGPGYGERIVDLQEVTLSSFLFASNAESDIIDFVKVDVEGAEIFCLTNEEIQKTKGKVRTFFVECHPSQNYGMDECLSILLQRFLNNGYKVETLDYQTFTATYDC